MAVPNIKLYQLASHFWYLVDWVRNDPDSVWLDIEAFNLGKPLALASFPFILNWKDSEVELSREESNAQQGQDERDDHQLSEVTVCSPPHQRPHSGESGEHQVPQTADLAGSGLTD